MKGTEKIVVRCARLIACPRTFMYAYAQFVKSKVKKKIKLSP
jgi:hypothetical protein